MAAAGKAKSKDVGERKRRLLIVDDAEVMRTYLASLLEIRGYQVDTAEDGRSALALLEGGAAPDVVILDVMMPGIDGLETLRRIRELDPELPVVMLSVVGKAATIVGRMQLGAADYLNKPFEEDELEAVLEKWTIRRGLERERSQLRAAVGDPVADSVWESESMRSIRDGARADRRHGRHGADPGRERRRQGDRRAGRPRPLDARERALRQGELCGAARRAAGERALRLREGRLHRRQRRASRGSSRWPTRGRSSSTRSAR